MNINKKLQKVWEVWEVFGAKILSSLRSQLYDVVCHNIYCIKMHFVP